MQFFLLGDCGRKENRRQSAHVGALSTIKFTLFWVSSFFLRGIVYHYFSFVDQFTFTPMGTMTHMRFTAQRISTDGCSNSFVVRTTFCTALSRMATFRIWHNLKIKKNKN